MKAEIKEIIESTETTQGKVFAFAIQFLIVISLITFSISTLPNLSESTTRMLLIIEIITVSIFTLEYILRIVVADNKPGFIFSFNGIIDLIAILPFYLSLGIDLRVVRIFRLLRLFRILKIFRYSKACTSSKYFGLETV